MTASYRFRGVGWFLSGVIVVLGFYLVSLQVAAERQKVERVAKAILAAERDIRSLETEFNTRANLAQLERWNGDVLALAAPTAGQFLSDEAALAQIDFNRDDLGGKTGTRIENVAYLVPAMPHDAAAPPPAVQNGAVAVAAVAPPVPANAADAPTRVAQAAKPAARIVLASAASVPTHAAAGARTQTIAMLDRSLLSDATIGDLVSGARAESAGLR